MGGNANPSRFRVDMRVILGNFKKFIAEQHFMFIGLVAVSLLYLSVAGMVSVTTPWYSPKKNDTNRHVDYVWRLYNGQIPKYNDGVTYPPFLQKGYTSTQNAAANPPLFYLIHAPFVGPLLNHGKWERGIELGRAINLIIGLSCILALAWAGWLYGGRRKALFAVVVPALAVLNFWFLRLNRYYALDSLVVFIGTLNFVFIYKVLKHGLHTKYLIALTIISVAGMLTKASHIVMLLATMLAIMIASVMKLKTIKPRDLIKGMIINTIILLVVAISTGWFYYFWNYKSSGSWFKAVANPSTSRPYKSLRTVLASPDLWSLFYAQLTSVPVISTVITSLATAGVLMMNRLSLKKMIHKKSNFWSIAILAIVFSGIFTTQVVLGVGYGSINFRYLLPAILPISLFLAYGLLEYKNIKGQLAALSAIGMAGTTLLSTGVGTNGNIFPGEAWLRSFRNLQTAAVANGLPTFIVKSLILSFIVGALMLCLSIYHLSTAKNADT